MHILIAEAANDDTARLKTLLERDGHNILLAADSAQALDTWDKEEPDLVLADAALPGEGGLELLKRVRQTSFVPVILVSELAEELDVVLGLELGADDYVKKPYSPRELCARVKAIKRRTEAARHYAIERAKGAKLVYGDLEILTDCYEVYLKGSRVRLTPKETELLIILAQSPGKVFVRSSLINQIWGYDYVGDERIVDSLVRHLRAKLDCDGQPWRISTIYSIGYKLEVDKM